MPDIYGKDQEFRQTTFSTTDYVKLHVGNSQKVLVEFLVQDINLNYQQPLQPIYEIGSRYGRLAPGRPIGQMSIGRIIGERTISSVLGDTGSGMWSTDGAATDKTITIVLRNGMSYKLSGANIGNYGAQLNANNLLIQESVQITFIHLEIIQPQTSSLIGAATGTIQSTIPAGAI